MGENTDNFRHFHFPDDNLDYEDSIKVLQSLVDIIKEHIGIFDTPAHEDLYLFFNRSLFVALNNLDLLIGFKYLDLSVRKGNELEASYFARVVALHLHEIYNDLNKLINGSVRKLIKDRLGEDFLDGINGLLADFNSLKKQYKEELKEIRNNAIGHRDADAVKQTDLMSDINFERLYDLIIETIPLQLKVNGYYLSVVEKLSPYRKLNP